MKNKSYEKFLDKQYKEIVGKIIPNGQVSYLYGVVINPKNVKQLVVAAYYTAKQEETDKRMEELGIFVRKT